MQLQLPNFTYEKLKKNLELAAEYGATKGTCDRLRVGCIVCSEDGSFLFFGANASPLGKPGCDAIGHLMIDNHCMRTIHAEQTVVSLAAKEGKSIDGGVAFVSHTPCLHCAKILINAGIKHIYYRTEYANAATREQLDNLSNDMGVPIGLLPKKQTRRNNIKFV